MLIAQQASAVSPAFSSSALSVTLVVSALVLVTAAAVVVLFFRHLRFNREKQHEERLKMIEFGYPLEDSQISKRQERFMHNSFWISFWLVAAVPSVFSAAATATNGTESAMAVMLVIWAGAGFTGVAAVVCATVLMVYTRFSRDEIVEDVLAPKMPPKMP